MNIIAFFIYYLLSILMIIITIMCYSYLSEKIIILSKLKIIGILICCIFVFLNNIYNLVSLRYITSIILVLIVNKIVFNDNFNNLSYYTIIYSILSIIVDLTLSCFLINNIQNIDIFNNQVFFKSLFSLLESLILLFITKNKWLISLVNKIKKIINFYSISLIILLFLDILTIFRFNETSNKVILNISLIAIIFIIIIIKIIVNDKYNLKILEEKNKCLKDSSKAYSETIDECKEFKHNVKNELYCLKTLLPNEYRDNINKLLIKYNKEYEWINYIGEIPEGLQGIIYLKINEAKTKKVKIILNTKNQIKTNDKDYLNISSVLGILIDNAIEASYQTKNKIVEIRIEEAINCTNIKILNRFVNKIDLNNIGKKNYSTKEYKSGIGLNYLKKINNNIKVNFNIINDLFITNIKFNNK